MREHVHPDNDAVIFVPKGSGGALLNGADKVPMAKGTCVFLGRGHTHRFQASEDGPMTFMWLMMPGGLETYFSRIGRKRKPGDQQPPNFPRSTDVPQIEAETVFGTLAFPLAPKA